MADWNDRLDKFARYCIISFIILFVVYIIFSFAWGYLLKDNLLGMRDAFGCDPNTDPCCPEGFNKTAIVRYQCPPGGQCISDALKQLCTPTNSIIGIFIMLLFFVGLAAYILSRFIKLMQKLKNNKQSKR